MHAKALVADENFKLDESIEIRIDPDERGYPKTEADRNELWRRLVHFQMSNYLGAGEKLPEAKRLLAHRYELRTKRLRELPQWEIYSIFLDSFATVARPALELPAAGRGRGFPHLDVAVARGDRRGALGARRLLGGGADHPGRRGRPDREGPRAQRQDHRGRRRGRRVGQHRRHAAARGGQPDPRQEGHQGAPDRAAPGRRDGALPARDRARQDRPRRAGGEPALRDARAQRQAVQARDHRPALVLRRFGSRASASAPTTSRSCSSR